MPAQEGVNAVAQASFVAPTLYVGLVAGAGFTGFSTADTMASHPGWSEYTGYSSATRPLFTPTTVLDGFVSNLPGVDFTPTATGAVVGWFLSTHSTKGGTTGTLHGPVAFEAGSIDFGTSDPVRVQCDIQVTARGG